MNWRAAAAQALEKAFAARMVRAFALFLFWISLAGLVFATLCGLIAPWIPHAEMFNDFRPFWLAGASTLLGLGLAARASRVGIGAAVAMLFANAALAAAPAIWSADAGIRRTLRVTTFNVWVSNPTPAAVVDFLKSTGADVILLQEVDARLEKAIAPGLKADYPHILSCAARNCGLMLLSKSPWTNAGFSDRTRVAPPLIWAEFQGYTVTGTHLAYPFQPLYQMNHIDSLSRRFRTGSKVDVLAGDFNLTPYSWKLNLLSLTTGLRRHATVGATWPANKLAPMVLLDNLLTGPSVRSTSVTFGPRGLGSDHRPATFDLEITNAAASPPS